MHKIDQKLKLLIFFLNFDLAKGGEALAPLAPPGCALEHKYLISVNFLRIFSPNCS